MTILYLYTNVMGYTFATINELLKKEIEVHVVHWNKKEIAHHFIYERENLFIHKRDENDFKSLDSLINKINPSLFVVSGWQDKTYLRLCLKYRRSGPKIIVGFDDQWHSQIHQQLALLIGKLRLFHLFFTHAWVAGIYQFEYARKLGFRKTEVINDLYSADLDLYHSESQPAVGNLEANTILIVARLEKVKGLDLLAQAWTQSEYRKGNWRLKICGTGSLEQRLTGIDGIDLLGFMSPSHVKKEIQSAKFVLLPSIREPWGVVIHEYLSMGKPVITTNIVGAASTFLIHGFNGFKYESKNITALVKVLNKAFSMEEAERVLMGKRSLQLSTRITPETSAYNLLSVFND